MSQVVHVAVGGVLGAALAETTAPVIIMDDNVLLGPSRADAKRHQAARTRYWGSAPSPELAEELARGAGPPLCVTIPPTPCGILSLCQISCMAMGSGREVHVVDLGAESAGLPPQGIDPGEETYVDAAAALRHSPPAARWTTLATTLAATLWRLWCRPSPTALSRFCASGGALHPQFANLGCFHAGFFPRVTGGALGLSRIDELILRQLSREWTTPAKVFVQAMTNGSELVAWLSHTGDLHLAARLLAWSRHTRNRIVERRREHPKNPSEMTRWSFRWRPGGEAILEALPDVEVAPPVSIGGAVAYAPDPLWVGRLDAAGRPYVSRAGIRGSTPPATARRGARTT
ncbi:MAG: hypothetical protein QM820_14450 [Minicystis sp.]